MERQPVSPRCLTLVAQAGAVLGIGVCNAGVYIAEVDAAIGTAPSSPVGVATNGHAGGFEGVSTDGSTDEVNPGDLILDLACGSHATDLVRAFERSQDRAGMAQTIGSLVTAGDERLVDGGNIGFSTGFKTNRVAMFHVQVSRVVPQ